jgi:hypothetical protein
MEGPFIWKVTTWSLHISCRTGPKYYKIVEPCRCPAPFARIPSSLSLMLAVLLHTLLLWHVLMLSAGYPRRLLKTLLRHDSIIDLDPPFPRARLRSNG